MHKGNQGSVIAVTDASQKIIQQAVYDPFGKRSEIYQIAYLANNAYVDPTDRGYTGHKELTHVGITHMKGRIYDPTLGRFLQADPFIQAPTNSQNYNRYSYVLNSPLSYTDPSGYILNKISKPFKKLGRAIIRGASKIFGQNLVQKLGNWASLACGPFAPACSGYWNYEFARAHGASSSGALRGAFVAAVGTYIGENESFNNSQKLALNFALDSAVKSQERNARATQIQTVSRTYSEVSGGKFANGAATAAMAQLFNAETSNHKRVMLERARMEVERQFRLDEYNNNPDKNAPQGAIVRQNKDGEYFIDDQGGNPPANTLVPRGRQIGCEGNFCFFPSEIPIKPGADALVIGTPTTWSPEYIETRQLSYFQGLSNQHNVDIILYTRGKNAGSEWTLKPEG